MNRYTYIYIYVYVCVCVFTFTVAQASTCSMPQQESRVGDGDGGRGPTETCHNISEFMSEICKPFTQLDPAQFFRAGFGVFSSSFSWSFFLFLFLSYWHCPKMRCAILTRLLERCLVSLSAGKNRMVHTHFGAFR